jgi:uncharacterized phage-associated protein
MLSAKRAAECFLYLSGQQVECDITPLKLQKLLYYAEGYSLALRGEPLFREPIMAWRYGPVVRSVYKTYEFAGRNSIPCLADLDMTGFQQDELDIIKTVMDFYGSFSAQKLVDMTHSEYPYRNTPLDHEISRDDMREFFREKIFGFVPPEIEDAGFTAISMEGVLSCH